MTTRPSDEASQAVPSRLASSTRITFSTNPFGISESVALRVVAALYAGITTTAFAPRTPTVAFDAVPISSFAMLPQYRSAPNYTRSPLRSAGAVREPTIGRWQERFRQHRPT